MYSSAVELFIIGICNLFAKKNYKQQNYDICDDLVKREAGKFLLGTRNIWFQLTVKIKQTKNAIPFFFRYLNI